jgi:glucosylceramidase
MRSTRGRAACLVAMLLIAGANLVAAEPALGDAQSVGVWLTTADLTSALTAQSNAAFSTDSGTNPLTIDLDAERTFQSMTGFGATFTDSAAWLLYTKQNSTQRSAVLNSVFGASGIGLNILRQPIGSTDFIKDIGGYYTYDDVANDTDLSEFSIAHDDSYIIPVIQEALTTNPSIKVNLTSWSAPAWMKDSGTLMAPYQDGYPGTLLSQFKGLYADYLVRAYQAYESRGIPIWSTSAQNEPTTGNTYNTMLFSSAQSIDFITNYLAPRLHAAGLQPRILAGDTVCFDPWYTADVFNDSAANQDTEGSSDHGYCGSIADLSLIHNWYPYKPIYQMEVAPYCTDTDFRDIIINAPRNWAQSIVAWNVALDTTSGPYHTGAENICDSESHPGIPIQPLVTIDQSTGSATYRPTYYWLGHVSKFVQPGAVRVASNSFGSDSVQDVAFLNPDGTRVLVAWNRDVSAGGGSSTVKVREGSQSFSYAIPKGAMVTFTWSGGMSGSAHGWGDSVRGTDTNIYDGGLRRGTWTTTSATQVATTSLGAGWNSLYWGSDSRLYDYRVTVQARRTATGGTSPYPKYGLYACYVDKDNSVQAWIDPVNNEFVSHVRIGGVDYGWNGTQALPTGFDPGVFHTITAQREGITYHFFVDAVEQPSRQAPIAGCQVGLVSEDTAVEYQALSLLDRIPWGDSLYRNSPSNIYGGGLQRGDWVVDNSASVGSNSLGSGWSSIYRGAGMNDSSYTLTATATRLQAGTTSAYPKYGVYGCYKDDSNYVQAWIDPNAGEFVTHVLVNGTDLGWGGTQALPVGFDPTQAHTIIVQKSGSTFTFQLDSVAQPSRTAAISGCQIGLVTEDVRALFRGVIVS